MSVLDPTQPGGAQPPLVDIDQIEPDESLLADLHKTRVTTPVTRVLLVLIVLAVGFLGGALVDRSQRSSSSSNSAQSLINSFRRARTGGASGASGATGTGAAGGLFGGGAGGGATVGTVKLVDGDNVYVEDTSGNVIKVKTDARTQVTVSKAGTVKQLAPGSTVIVQGSTSSDGSSMTATSITPSTGFGGRGGFGNAAAAAG